jgi:hypothetical protein
MATITKPLIVYVPDTRGVVVSQYGLGNTKIGPGVFTYSRMPGRPDRVALGVTPDHSVWKSPLRDGGTCPGASAECQTICYASRPVVEDGIVSAMWAKNSQTADVPPIPDEATLIRLHISGDFDTYDYIVNWIARMVERPDVTMWVYTRSWRVPSLLPALEVLRALPNVQMFASMDVSVPELPPEGWRRAWIDGDPRVGRPFGIKAHTTDAEAISPWKTFEEEIDARKVLICPEETKAVANCEQCGFCFKGQRNDVVFLRH